MMQMIVGYMIEVHFKIVMASINGMFWWCMEVKLNRLEHLVFSIVLVHHKVTIDVSDVNPHCVTQVLDLNVSNLSIVSIESQLM